MMPAVDIFPDSPLWSELAKVEALVTRAVEAAIETSGLRASDTSEISVLLTDDAAVRELNRTWRGIDKPTNVLSFPAPDGPDIEGEARHLGDIALAFETTRREALDEGKPLANHVSHLVVHGVLHLLGYDHEEDEEAELMEAREVEALARLGIPDPYADSYLVDGGAPGRVLDKR